MMESEYKKPSSTSLSLRKKLRGVTPRSVVKKLGGAETISMGAGIARVGVKMLKQKRQEMKQRLTNSQEFVDDALALAESKGWSFETDEDKAAYLDAFTEAAIDEAVVGMASIGTLGTISRETQIPGGDRYPGMDKIDTDGQRNGPRTNTQSGDEASAQLDKEADIKNKDFDKNQTRGPDSFPALGHARPDGQRAGPKAGTRSAEEHHPVAAESLHTQIYNSLAGKRVRSNVNEGRSPSPVEIKQIAETEGFKFENLEDLDNFMKMALVEKLYPSVGPTKAANQLKGDGFPALSTVSKEMQKLGPKDSTIGQNKTGARDAKAKGEAPHTNYKNDGPKGSTRQFEQDVKKVCPVCNQKNGTTSVYCGACGAVLPPRPEDNDGGIPVSGRTGGKRNWNTETDGGLPKVRSPYGGSKNPHYYLKSPPTPMKEHIAESKVPESSRIVLFDMLRGDKRIDENIVDYSPQGVHDKLKMPGLGAVNSKAKALGVNDITQGELDMVVGLFQQGETTGKLKLYTGVELRLTQSIANMMGIGASHGYDKGMTDNVTSANLHPNA